MTEVEGAVTPMMAQYLKIKAESKDSLLFYRMGDFYELFLEDAIVAAAALDITLTKRGTHNGAPIPMCGVPAHSAEGYLLTLIRKGFRVTIAEQTEDPADAKKRGYKTLVRRAAQRLVTSGTLTEDGLLDARRHNYLAAWAEIRDEGALAWVDISTGELRVIACTLLRLGPEIARIAPREVLICDQSLEPAEGIIKEIGPTVTVRGQPSFDTISGNAHLLTLFKDDAVDIGVFTRPEIAAIGALIDYIDLTQRGNLPLLQPPIRETVGSFMQIDPTTRRSLEITNSVNGDREAALIGSVDRTITAAGARLLDQRLSAPSCNLSVINARLAAVHALVNDAEKRMEIREVLRLIPDIDRALSRLSLDRGGPRDMSAIRAGLDGVVRLAPLIAHMPPLLQSCAVAFGGHDDFLIALDNALIADPPILARDGGFIKPGYDSELDATCALRDEGREIIAELQGEYIALTGIQSLKIKHNNVLGYFVETPASHADKMHAAPLNQDFIHRQTTAGQVRFTTIALSALEARILNAGNLAQEIEREHFETLRRQILLHAGQIGAAARALAEVDVAASFADIAVSQNWVAPKVDNSRAFHVIGGRHPVVESAMQRQGGKQFVANDLALSTGNSPAIWLVTGPNMSGKSTFLRQNALIAILAQVGSFVPAASAHIGMVSQLFSRVGASDDLTRGRSTFMVEMVETAAILNQADDRSFVILDEIGRGTATYDGLSIAWATLEHLHEVNQCRGLFATHYHEMTALAQKLSGVENATVAVKEWNGDVIFLHELRKGAADRSYGVQVARLAGLPDAVIARAKAVLEQLERGERERERPAVLIDDLPLFRVAPHAAETRNSAVEARLKALHPDALSPKEALDLLYELKTMLRE